MCWKNRRIPFPKTDCAALVRMQGREGGGIKKSSLFCPRMHITICDIMLPSLPPSPSPADRPMQAKQVSPPYVQCLCWTRANWHHGTFAIDARPRGEEGQMDTKVSQSIMGPPTRVFPYPQERREKRNVFVFPSCVTWGEKALVTPFLFFEENLVSHDPVFHPAPRVQIRITPNQRKLHLSFGRLKRGKQQQTFAFSTPTLLPNQFGDSESPAKFLLPTPRERRSSSESYSGMEVCKSPNQKEERATKGFSSEKKKKVVQLCLPPPLYYHYYFPGGGGRNLYSSRGGWDETIFRHDWVCPPLTAKGKLSIQFSYSSDVRTTDLVWWTTAKCTKKFPKIPKIHFRFGLL